MTIPIPAAPKIYHIVHVDRLSSIVRDQSLWSDALMIQRQESGTTIGMSKIKARRLNELTLTCHPGLHVGQCAPFYFCPRSVMLFLIHRRNVELAYQGGQEPIVHLEADFHAAVKWAEANDRRWAITLSNAGAYYFEDRSNIASLSDINWDAIHDNWWGASGVPGSVKEGKQAEFLVEHSFPWELVERIGTFSRHYAELASNAIGPAAYRPRIEIRREWYYPG